MSIKSQFIFARCKKYINYIRKNLQNQNFLVNSIVECILHYFCKSRHNIMPGTGNDGGLLSIFNCSRFIYNICHTCVTSITKHSVKSRKKTNIYIHANIIEWLFRHGTSQDTDKVAMCTRKYVCSMCGFKQQEKLHKKCNCSNMTSRFGEIS